MSIERVDTADDVRVSEYSHITDRELLQRRGLFVAEGRLVVQRVIEQRRFAVRSLLLSDAALDALSPCLAGLPQAVPIHVCQREMFQRLTGHDIHRGCLALVERPPATSVDDVIRGAQLIVVLEDVADADNVGGVFRNAAAFGADAVLLSPSTCDPLYRKAIRTSMAAALTVPFARVANWPAGLADLTVGGFTVVALAPRGLETLDAFAARPRPSRLALLVGAEGPGLSEAAIVHAAFCVRIPMRQGVDSLNLAVVVGIALSRFIR